MRLLLQNLSIRLVELHQNFRISEWIRLRFENKNPFDKNNVYRRDKNYFFYMIERLILLKINFHQFDQDQQRCIQTHALQLTQIIFVRPLTICR